MHVPTAQDQLNPEQAHHEAAALLYAEARLYCQDYEASRGRPLPDGDDPYQDYLIDSLEQRVQAFRDTRRQRSDWWSDLVALDQEPDRVLR